MDAEQRSSAPASRAGPAEQAQALMEVGRYREAIDLVGRALTATPDDPLLLGMRSLCHSALGENAEALASAQRAIRLSPDDEWGHRVLASAHENARQIGPMVAAARQAHRLGPEQPRNVAILVRGLLDCGRPGWKEAEARVADLERLAPDWEETHRLGAVAASRRKDWRLAARRARRAVAANPRSIDALFTLSQMEEELDRKHRLLALETMHRALLLDPQNDKVRTALMQMIDRRFRVPLVLYGFAGLLFPGMYLLAIGEIVYKVFLGTFSVRKLSPAVQALVRKRLRTRRLQGLWQILLLVCGPAAIVWGIVVAVDPARRMEPMQWLPPLLSLLLAAAASYALYRLERTRRLLL